MPVLSVRISEKEKELLASRAKASGISTGSLVRQLIREAPFANGAELLAELQSRLGDARLRIRRR